MKKLYLIRHAKSSWDNPVADFDRDLNKRGEFDAPLIGKELKKREINPDLIISSPALRAKKTALILAKEIGYNPSQILFKDSIYESSLYNLLMIIKELDISLESVMIVGHNPSMTELINKISKFSISNLPTCGVVALELDSWSEIEPYSAKEIFYIYPKMFKS